MLKTKTKKGKKCCSTQEKQTIRINIIINPIDVCKMHRTSKTKIMDKTTLFNAANYLVHLYDKIGDQFASDPVKIQKMLFISLIYSYDKYNDSFLNKDIDIEFCECGIKIKEVYGMIRNYISDGERIDKPIEKDKIDNSIYKKMDARKKGFNEDDIPKDIKDILLGVFFRFGSYNSTSLGELINDLRKSSRNDDFHQKIPFLFKMSEIPNLINETSATTDSNQIMEYIKQS